MFWHLRQLFLNLFIIYEKHILNYSGGVFKGVFKGVHFQNEKCDCIKYLKLVDADIKSGKIKVYTNETLKKQAVLRIFETNVNENKLLRLPILKMGFAP